MMDRIEVRYTDFSVAVAVAASGLGGILMSWSDWSVLLVCVNVLLSKILPGSGLIGLKGSRLPLWELTWWRLTWWGLP